MSRFKQRQDGLLQRLKVLTFYIASFVQSIEQDGGFIADNDFLINVLKQLKDADLVCPMSAGKDGKLYFLAGDVDERLKRDDFKYETRLRRETFDSSTRQQRIRIMGDPTKYVEVLHVSPGGFEQEDTLGTNVLDASLFRVNLWLAYKDDDDYNLSSQADFDDICFADDGIIPTLQDEPSGPYPGFVVNLQNIESLVVSLDESGKELAHFLTFQIVIR